jgi:hypothetical protein
VLEAVPEAVPAPFTLHEQEGYSLPTTAQKAQ